MRRRAHLTALLLLLAACSDRAITPDLGPGAGREGGPGEAGPEPESGTRCQGTFFTSHQPTHDDECHGHVGCSQITP